MLYKNAHMERESPFYGGAERKNKEIWKRNIKLSLTAVK